MKNKTISKKSFWYMWSSLTTNDIPETTCGLAWHMIFSLITFPLWIFPGLVINGFIKLINKHYTIVHYVYYILLNIIIPIFGAMYYTNHNTTLKDVSFLQIYGYGILLFIRTMAGMIACIAIIGVIAYYFSKAKIKLSSNEITLDLYKSLKEKHCSRINWK